MKKYLDLIKVDQHCNWHVPNRKMLGLSIEQFGEFERQRLQEFNEFNKKGKYYYHYKGEEK